MMRKFVLLSLVLAVLCSCDSMKVVSDYDKNVDFTQYKSIRLYGWAKNSDEILNSFNKDRIERAVIKEFQNRGHELVESDADIVVSLYVVSEEKTERTATTTHMGGMGGYYGYGPGWGWGGGYSTTSISDYDYTVGTLVISVYDSKKKELIWEGMGQGTVKENSNNREADVNRTIKKILYNYPIKPSKK